MAKDIKTTIAPCHVLRDAFADDDVEKFKDRLVDYAKVDQQDIRWWPYAAEKGAVNIVKYCMENGMFDPKETINGFTAIEYVLNKYDAGGDKKWAYEKEHKTVEIIHLFYQAGVPCTQTYAVPGCMLTIKHGFIDLVKAYYALPNFHGIYIDGFDTRIHLAIQYEHDDVFNYLLEQGADVTCEDENGDEPIHLAVKVGRWDYVKALFDCDVDPGTIRLVTHETLLHVAAKAGQTEVYDNLLSEPYCFDEEDMDAFGIKACEYLEGYRRQHTVISRKRKQYKDLGSNAGIIEDYLVSYINEQCDKAEAAVRKARRWFEEICCDYGANPDSSVSRLVCCYDDFIKTLRELEGLTIFREQNIIEAKSLLEYAIKNDFNRLIRSLIESGVDVNAASADNDVTPLQTALKVWAFDIVELLVKHGADVNKPNAIGSTPLHYAASGNSEHIIRFLLKHGADKTVKNQSGSTPKDLAVHNGHDRIAEML